MILIPAIDIKDGKVVRLAQGKFKDVTHYPLDPVTAARNWENKGAKRIHVVDLDGAQSGTLKNREWIIKIAKTVKIPVQTGGGIRQEETVRDLLDNGLDRVILGTSAVEDKGLLRSVFKAYAAKIGVSLDCSNGFVTTRGWTVNSQVRGTELARELEAMGLTCLIYTDIARDGMLQGPNFTAIELILKAVKIPVIASGGIATIEDVKKLLKISTKNLTGAITGKAIYEGTLDFQKGIELCSQSA